MLHALKRVLFWTYPRGSWQYDILCGLIICFIFLTPRAVFDGSAFVDTPSSPGPSHENSETVQAAAARPSGQLRTQETDFPQPERAVEEEAVTAR